MKTIVYDRDFQELEIKPSEAIAAYRQLLARDVQSQLADSRSLAPRACPGCRAEKASPAFEKIGLAYVECDECHSVFVSPCPSDEELAAFYRESESAHFWRGHLWEQTQEVRLNKVYRPRVEWIVDTVDRYRSEASLWVDVGAHSRLMLEELASRKGQATRIVATNPNADLDCLGAAPEGVDVRPMPVSEIAAYGPADVVLAFDILPRIADVDRLFTAA